MRTEKNRLSVFTLVDGTEITTRSILEARWAIFFTELELPWKYEPIRFGWYVPDFGIDKFGLIEIKPTLELLISESAPKIKRAAKLHSQRNFYVFVGSQVSFETVALYRGEQIFAPTHWHMVKIISKFSNRHVETAMLRANAARLDHFLRIGKVLELTLP